MSTYDEMMLAIQIKSWCKFIFYAAIFAACITYVFGD